MDHSLKVGVSFGLTSGIITTLGLMAGLNSGTHSRLAVIGGIITIAVADAFSDSLGIHISEESENVHTRKEIWRSTLATFMAKFIFALTFLIPVLFFELRNAVIISVVWGLFALSFLSYRIAKIQKSGIINAILEHVGIAAIVIIVSHLVGDFVAAVFV
jgi:VIT1/CCC1 family predicted Fe2+/Mn2+ transporter